MALIDKITAIANAIRGKTGGTDKLTLEQMATEIAGIETGGSDGMLAAVLSATATSVVDNTLEVISVRAFDNNKYLTNVSFPNLKRITSQYLFNVCSNLETVDVPQLEQITGMRTFTGCAALKTLTFPSLKFASAGNIFENCTSLECVDFANANITGGSISSGTFTNCSALKKVILRARNGIWAITNSNAFNGTPFASGGTGGTVYVPQALIEKYKTATNWSSLHAAGTCNFAAIEGSEYE